MSTEIYCNKYCNKYGKCFLIRTADEISFDEKMFVYSLLYLDKNIDLRIYGVDGFILITIEIDEYIFRLSLRTKNFHTKNIHTESTPDKVLDKIKIDGRIHITNSTEYSDIENTSFLNIETKSDPENDDDNEEEEENDDDNEEEEENDDDNEEEEENDNDNDEEEENDIWISKYKKIIDSHIADKIVSSLSEGVTIDKICDIVRCK